MIVYCGTRYADNLFEAILCTNDNPDDIDDESWMSLYSATGRPVFIRQKGHATFHNEHKRGRSRICIIRDLAMMHGFELERREDSVLNEGEFYVDRPKFVSRSQLLRVRLIVEDFSKLEALSVAVDSMREFELALYSSSEYPRIRKTSDETLELAKVYQAAPNLMLPVRIQFDAEVAFGVLTFIRNLNDREWESRLDWVDGKDSFDANDRIFAWSAGTNNQLLVEVISE